jgi:CSLREA domain-containing protein
MNKKRINFESIKLTLLTIFMSLFLTVSAQALTYTVNTTADNGVGGCTALGTGDGCTLREAIAAANGTAAADIIDFSPTIFNVSRTITLNGTQLSISGSSTNSLTINGTGANMLTVSGNNASRVFSVAGAGIIINGITITAGNGVGTPFTGLGGGIFMNPGTLTLNNTIISNNTNNGIYSNSGTITVNNSTLTGNTGGAGAAAFSFRATLTINNSTVNGNTATNEGGGIEVYEGTASLTNSTFSGNSGTIGGGIYNFGGAVTLSNLTINSNTATTSGGGFQNSNSGSLTGTTSLNNTIIANSTSGGDCFRNSGTVNATYSLIESGIVGCVNGTNSNNLTGDPNLGVLKNNGGTTFTHELLAGSIAIDTGNSTLTPDQRGSGFTRPIDLATYNNAPGGNGSDIGAVELQIAPTAASVSIGGRILIGKRGVPNATVYLTEQNGNTWTSRTNPLGYYRFENVGVGNTVFINAYHKLYQFAPQVVTVNEQIEDFDITAENNRWKSQ